MRNLSRSHNNLKPLKTTKEKFFKMKFRKVLAAQHISFLRKILYKSEKNFSRLDAENVSHTQTPQGGLRGAGGPFGNFKKSLKYFEILKR